MSGLITPAGTLGRAGVWSAAKGWSLLNNARISSDICIGGPWESLQPQASWSSCFTCSAFQPVCFMMSSRIPKASCWASLVARHSAAMARKRIDRLATPLLHISCWSCYTYILATYRSLECATMPQISLAWLCCTVCISALYSDSTGFVFVSRIRAVWYSSRAMIVERLMSL